jgi:NSS family neurotransmitter:Na+ symporter
MSKETKNAGTAARSTFSSSLGFFLAAVGGAVGLGNVWGFPFKLGRGGGFPFLVIYVLCVFVVGVPICIAEYALGRKMRSGPVSAYKRISKKWTFLGWINMAVCIGVMGFYCLICGWLLKYACMFALSLVGLGGDFLAMDSATYFTAFVSKPLEPLIWTYAFMIINYLVIRKNISQGIEKSCKVMIPVLVVILIVVAIRGCTLPGADAGLDYLFKPNMTAFNEIGFFAVFTLALVQMWFSVNIGFGTNLLYGSYLPDDTNIVKSAIIVPIADMCVALLAGLAVMPAVFAYDLEPSTGAGLLFITLKTVFAEMPGGSFFGLIFFIAVLFAALSSTIGMTGAIATVGTDEFHWDNNKSSLVSTIIPCIIAIPVSWGYGLLSGVRPLAFLGKDTDLLDSLDFLCENVLATTAALLLCIFVGWVWKPKTVLEEVEKTGPFTWKNLWLFVFRFVCPIITVIVILSSLGLI